MDHLERAARVVELAREGDWWSLDICCRVACPRGRRWVSLGPSLGRLDIRIMMYLYRHPELLSDAPAGIDKHEA